METDFPETRDPRPPSGDLEGQIAARLVEIESLLGSIPPDRPGEVKRLLADLEDALSRPPLSNSPRADHLRAGLRTVQGHAARLSGRWAEAVSHYDDAIRLLGEPVEADRARQAANLWTCRSLALLSDGGAASLEEALRGCDRAILLRKAEVPVTRPNLWGLAAAWLNRADALAGLGGLDRFAEAVRSCGEAREALAEFDPAENPSYRTRRALAWMKEGDIEARRLHDCGPGAAGDPLACYAEAVAVLRPGAEQGAEESRRVLSVALANRSRLRLAIDGRGSAEGADDARAALGWLGDAESSDPETVALGATARIVLATHLGSLDGGTDRALGITDLAEEGLAIAGRLRQEAGPGAVRGELLGELVRIGAEAYLAAAPQFLADFVLDHLDPTRGGAAFPEIAEVHEAAVRALWRGIASVQQEGFKGIGSEAYEARRALLADWERCREELAAIRRIYFEIP